MLTTCLRSVAKPVTMKQYRLLISLALCSISLSMHSHAKDEWGPRIKYTTSWKKAIREVEKTGKILLIYNGWQEWGQLAE